ncbi:hypothetical protein EDC04DRAFT_2613607 [Pisolithus marmoratus]|nr:hypothetical protein EDC04DRAFT_2613607 [Pisolithus marmoratus]
MDALPGFQRVSVNTKPPLNRLLTTDPSIALERGKDVARSHYEDEVAMEGVSQWNTDSWSTQLTVAKNSDATSATQTKGDDDGARPRQLDPQLILRNIIPAMLPEESNIRPVSTPAIIRGDINVPETSYICRYPDNITLLQGNHESTKITQVYRFYGGSWIHPALEQAILTTLPQMDANKSTEAPHAWKGCYNVFDHLNLAVSCDRASLADITIRTHHHIQIIDGETLCVRGGLSPDLAKFAYSEELGRSPTKAHLWLDTFVRRGIEYTRIRHVQSEISDNFSKFVLGDAM